MTVKSNALIVGASRGLGLALAQEFLARQWQVTATVRGQQTELHKLDNDDLTIEQLEMTNIAPIKALESKVSNRKFDVLFVNAGVALGAGDRIDQVSDEDFVKVMVTNALSPMRVVESLGPLVSNDGIIAVMSSSLGSVGLNETGGWEVYRGSKAALNTLMRSYAARHKSDRRSLALVDPGWVKTDMGGDEAALEIHESIPKVVDNLLACKGQSGLRYFDYRGKTVPW